MRATKWSKLVASMVVVAVAATIALTQPAYGAGPELVGNNSVETPSTANPLIPDLWSNNSWGTNATTFTYTGAGHTGGRGLRVDMTSRSSGDAKWIFRHVPVQAGTTYAFSDFYKSNVSTELTVEVLNANGSLSYYWLKSAPARSAWTAVSANFVAPAGAVSMTVFHLISRKGFLETDDYSLTGPGSDLVSVAVSAPLGGASVSGSVTVSASTGGSGIVGVTFRVDGVVVGVEDTVAPYSVTWNSASVQNGGRSLTAEARTSSGSVVVSSPVSVTVNNAVPVSVAVSAPLGGASVSGSVTVSASTGGSGIVGVTFRVDGVVVGVEDTVAPYSVTWNSASVQNGGRSLTAEARTSSGSVVVSSPVSVTVNNAVPVSVAVSAPLGGASVSGSVMVSASTGGSGIVGVTFRVDGVVVGVEDTVAPYSVTWNSASVQNGGRSLTAEARTSSGSVVVSSPVSVTVNNAVPVSVAVSAPLGGASVSGSVTVSASTGGSGIVGVTFRVDGVVVGVEDTVAPYSVTWNSASVQNGGRSLTAEARTSSGSVVVSSPVSVTVNNAVPVSVAVSAPLGGASVSGSVTVSASTGGSGIVGVTFRVDGVVVGVEDTVAPYSVTWNSASVQNGGRSLTAEARTSSGSVVVSSPVSVTVNNAVPVSVAVSAPLGGASVSGSVTVSASTGGSGIVGVTFRVDGVVVGVEDTVAPYSVTWNTTSVQNGQHVLAAEARTASTTTPSDPVLITVANAVGPAPGEILANGSVEIANGSVPVSWSSNSWGSNNSTFTYPTGQAHGGSRFVRVDITSWSSGDAKWLPAAQPVTPGTTYRFTDWYRSNVTNQVLAVFAVNGSTVYQWLDDPVAAPTWTKYTTTFVAPPGASSVTMFHLIYGAGWLELDDLSLTPNQATPFNRPLVSLTFDDGWASHSTQALPALAAAGMDGTFYISTNLLNTPGYLTTVQLQALRDAGQDFGAHTLDHAHLTQISPAEQDRQLTESKAALEGILGRSINSMASPYGEYDAQVLAKMRSIYGAHRTVNTGFNNKADTDIYQLKVQNIYNTTTVAEVTSWVAAAQANGTWLILVFHNIVSNPDTYDTTPAIFQQYLQTITASGIAVSPVTDALAEVYPQLS